MRADLDRLSCKPRDAHSLHVFHDDIQGVLGTALVGVTSFTPRAYRSTSIVLPHIARGDKFHMTFQMPHRRKLGTVIDSVHLHVLPLAAAAGDVTFAVKYGWYGAGEVVPDTLPTVVASVACPLVAADQYKHTILTLKTNIAVPTSDTHSSILFFEVERLTTGDTWDAAELALAYMDAHFQTDRIGSANEYTEA